MRSYSLFPLRPIGRMAVALMFIPGLLVGAVQSRSAPAAELPLPAARTVSFTVSQGTWLSLDVSPDGRTILFELLGDLYTMSIDGGAAQAITRGMAFDSEPRYSPDGRSIAFVSDRDGADNVWIADADGEHPVQVTHGRASAYVSPTWSADGRYLLVSERRRGPIFELWEYDRSGGEGVPLVRSEAGADPPARVATNVLGPSVSPDGRYVYYAVRSGTVAQGHNRRDFLQTFPMWQVGRLDLETRETRVITRAQGGGIRPLVSPDGRRLVYGSRLDGRTGLRLRDLQSGDDRWLVYPWNATIRNRAHRRGICCPIMHSSPTAAPSSYPLAAGRIAWIWPPERVARSSSQPGSSKSWGPAWPRRIAWPTDRSTFTTSDSRPCRPMGSGSRSPPSDAHGSRTGREAHRGCSTPTARLPSCLPGHPTDAGLPSFPGIATVDSCGRFPPREGRLYAFRRGLRTTPTRSGPGRPRDHRPGGVARGSARARAEPSRRPRLDIGRRR